MDFSGKTLTKNIFITLISQIIPVFLGILLVPFILRKLGLDRFGFLSMSWMIIGYFSIFDFGLSRVLTKIVSEKIGEVKISGESKNLDLSSTVWPIIKVMTIISLVLAGIAILIAPWIIQSFFNIPKLLWQESQQSFLILCFAVPIVTLTVAFRGILEAYQDFKISNLMQALIGFGNYVWPSFWVFYSSSLIGVTFGLVVIRLIVFVFLLKRVLYFIPLHKNKKLSLETQNNFYKKFINDLIHTLKLGGWITVSNIISPIASYLDRIILGYFLPIKELSFYTTPMDVSTRLWLIPNVVTRVVMPNFSGISNSNLELLNLNYERGLKFVFFLMGGPVFILIVFAKELMTLWVGSEFANLSYLIAQILIIGVFLNSVSSIPFLLLQARNKAHIPAKISIIFAPVYFIALIYLIPKYGSLGASLIWTMQFLLSMPLLFYYSRLEVKFNYLKYQFVILVFIGIAFALSFLSVIIIKLISFFTCSLGFIFYIWKYYFNDSERLFIKNLNSKFFGVIKK